MKTADNKPLNLEPFPFEMFGLNYTIQNDITKQEIEGKMIRIDPGNPEKIGCVVRTVTFLLFMALSHLTAFMGIDDIRQAPRLHRAEIPS